MTKLLILSGVFFIGMSIGFLIDSTKPIAIVTVDKTDTTLVNQINELEKENNSLLDELQLKESEISYWGRKYDDLKHKRND